MPRKLDGTFIESGTITITQLSGSVNETSNAAYAQANAAYGQANTARSDANTTFATVNTTFASLNTSAGTQNTNIGLAYDQANNARSQANTARDTANSAYNTANTKLGTSGGSISGDLTISGNLVVQGNATTINVSNLSVNDSIILLATGSSGDADDIGFIGHIQRGGTNTHVGLIRKATENRFYLFDNYEIEPTNNVIDIANNNFRVANIRLNTINANSFVTVAGLDVTGQANAAYGQANTARSDANTTFGTINTTFATLNTSAGTQNTNIGLAYDQANSARTQANTARSDANTTFGTINTTFGTINTTFGTSNTSINNRVVSRNSTNWSDGTVISNVIGMLAWKNYGNNHVIFDASQGTAPNGASINNTNPAGNWTGSYPTLMGWNGSATYGVRVDSCRLADTVTDGMYLSATQSSSARKTFGGSQAVGSMLNATGSLGGLEAINPGGANAAFMSFHRVGVYASYFGIDTDNNFAVGGWSAGAALASMKVGSFGVGTAASGTAGEIRATNNITAYYSDARLKKFLGKIDNAVHKVNQLNGYYYVENEVAEQYGYKNKQEQVGVSAQEVEAVLPHIVTRAPFDIAKNEDGTEYSKSGEDYKTVRYERLVPLLIEAIKELKAEIEELKKR